MPTIEPQKDITVISIDPGYDRCGIAVITRVPGQKDRLVFSDCIQTDAKDEFVTRLFQIVSYFRDAIVRYKPNFFAIETLFFSKNQTTAMRVSETRGAFLYVAKEQGLSIMEINPMQIKLAVTGDGKSDKSQMIKMVQLITGMSKKAKDDEYDAIATGIAFMAMYRHGYSQVQ